MNDHTLREIQTEEGRLCPRYELEDESETAGRLAFFAVRAGYDNPLFRLAWDVETSNLEYDERRELLYTVLGALTDEAVEMRVKAAFDARIERAAAERKARS